MTSWGRPQLVIGHYSDLNASIGFNFDAFIAGIIPKIIPITIENTTDIIVAGMLIATGIIEILEII